MHPKSDIVVEPDNTNLRPTVEYKTRLGAVAAALYSPEAKTGLVSGETTVVLRISDKDREAAGDCLPPPAKKV
jgi:hypothetical protein